MFGQSFKHTSSVTYDQNDEQNNLEKIKILNKRNQYEFPDRLVNWFPGHMAKTKREILEYFKSIDFVIEIRDARVPLSSANLLLEEEVEQRKKQRMIIFNKSDLANLNEENRKKIMNYFETKESKLGCKIPILFTNAVKDQNVKQIITKCLECGTSGKKRFKSIPYVFMIMGIPNVGKSSLINSLRRIYHAKKGSNAKEGAMPGVTRHLSSFKVKDNPPCLLVDSPGVLFPNFYSHEQAYNLISVHTIKEFTDRDPSQFLSPETIADYILFKLNELNCFDYVKMFQLDQPNDDIQYVLQKVAQRYGILKSGTTFDLERSASQFIKLFRDGSLGKVMLDKL